MKKGENAEIEFKSARGGIPASLWESYSAFANTDGGTIVLGIQEKKNKFILDGLTEEVVARYRKNFWDCAHNKGKVSICLPREEDVRIEKSSDHVLPKDFDMRNNDNKILATAMKYSNKNVVIVTDDNNLKNKARSQNIRCMSLSEFRRS